MIRKTQFLAVLGILALCGAAWAVEPNLVSHWKFDEGSGTTAYDSVGGNVGTIYGDAEWTTGQVNGALGFDGVDDYVDCGNDESLNITSDITISALIYLTRGGDGSDASGQVIAAKTITRGAYNNPFDFRTSIGPVPVLTLVRADSNGHECLYSTEHLSLHCWHHVAVTVNNNDANFYVDGVITDKTGNGFTKPASGNSKPVYIGRRDDGLYFDGQIDDVRIYDRALSAEEIRQLYLDGFSSYERAIICVENAIDKKQAALEAVDAALVEEDDAYDALEGLLESSDFGDLKKGDIVKAKQKVHSAMQHQEQSADALEKSIEKLEDALAALGWEPEPSITYEVSPCDMDMELSAAEQSGETRFSVTVEGSYIHFEDMMVANCCTDELELEMTVEGNLITIHEIEHTTHFCLCICPYPVTATLGPFEPGTYTLEVYEDGFIGSTTVTIE